MAIGVLHEEEPGIASLVGGIADDVQHLLTQQVTLLRREIGVEIRRAKSAAITLAIGAGLATVGGLLLLMMVVYFLNTYTAIPHWGCYGLVCGVPLGTGALLLYLGGREAADVHLLAPPQTIEALKENVTWLKHPTTSEPT
jgi:hypothetical protein